MTPYVEHANISVSSLEKAVHFLQAALPEFSVRGQGVHDGTKWLHIGSLSSYLALNEVPGLHGSAGRLNHVGFVVDDVAAVKARLLAAGYREGFPSGLHPTRKRLYFLDSDGLEWEFVQYLTPDILKRNDYAD